MEIKPGYTRVTEVLSQWDKFSMIDPVVLERKKQIGTNVHQAIEDFNNALPVVLTDEEGGKYFQSFLLLFRKERFSIINSEFRLYDEDLMITGAIDALIQLPNKQGLMMVDWKTSATKDAIAWEMQAIFYLHLLRKNAVENISNTCWFVKLDKLGDLPSISRFEYSEDVMDDCRAAVKTYRRMESWINKRKFITDEYIF